MRTSLPAAFTTLIASAVVGCSAPAREGQAEPVAQSAAALEASTVIATAFDDSASPIHVQLRTCKSNTATSTHQVDCRVDAEYALIGGGALPEASEGNGAQPYLTESRPSDPRTWRASSREPSASSHHLTVYALGLRLDGVNTQKLRNAIGWKTASTTSDGVDVAADWGKLVLSGGGATTPSGSGERRLLADSWSEGDGWNVQSAAPSGTVPGRTEVTLLQIDDGIIEGFGALEVSRRSGSARSTSGGVHSTSLDVQAGWALMGLGALSSSDAGNPRWILGIIPDASARNVTVTTGGAGAGTTTPYLTQVRKMPGSHGLCNPGTALLPSMDSCVASICATRSECCSTSWDSTCVSLVESTCGRSCAQHTCETSVFEPTRWQKPDGSANLANCYYYAQNKYPDGQGENPGDSLNPDPEDFTASRLAALAAGDGLIPSTFSDPCPDNRTKVMLSCNSNIFNYHWYRQDAGGAWSSKFPTNQAEVKENNGYRPYTDVQNNRHEAFFCSCNPALPPQ